MMRPDAFQSAFLNPAFEALFRFIVSGRAARYEGELIRMAWDFHWR